MTAHTLGALIQHESASPPSVTGLAKVVPRDVITTGTPTEYELNELRWGAGLNGPHRPAIEVSTVNTSVPPTPKALEESQPPTPRRDQAVDAIVQSASNPRMNRWRLAAAGIMFFLMGLNDAATGALIPYMEAEYHIGYAIVSLIFVTNAVGFISMAPLSAYLDGRWGRSRTYIIATTLISLGYVALVCGPPFPVVVLSFYFLGCGMALFLAMTNAFIVNLLNGTVVLGFMHGLYGVSSSDILAPSRLIDSDRLVAPCRPSWPPPWYRTVCAGRFTILFRCPWL